MSMNRGGQLLTTILCGLILAIPLKMVSINLIGFGKVTQGKTSLSDCEKLGWFPSNFGLKDHTVFWYDGSYYIVSIFLPGETEFAYGRSIDMCSWDVLSPVLSKRIAGTWDEKAIWSPFVYQEQGVYYMYFTGVTTQFTQSILLATSTNPADPASWQPHGVVFQPDHTGMNWLNGQWANCRDPDVIKVGNLYFLYYTGSDISGGIIGMATASSPMGPWTDWGAILSAPSQSMAMFESPAMFVHDMYFYLAFHDTSNGERYMIGPSPSGPWTKPYTLSPGWAHEIWIGQDGRTYTSYLTNYSITISPLTWDTFFDPARILIGSNAYHFMIPLIWNQN